ncbi:hypothetical protein [Streptomyces sp. NPDC055099]
MRSKNARTTTSLLIASILLTAGAGALAGCGSEESRDSGAETHDPSSAPKPEVRARRVAEAWDGSKAAEVWGKGYYPMGEAVQLPEEGLHNEDDKQAYKTQNFALRSPLPHTSHGEGTVRWKNGGSLMLPVVSARQAYETVARGGNDGAKLVVTGAQLGEMDLATSRGPATVPAWLFTLEGYKTPLKRAAVRPSKLPTSPIGPSKDVSANELSPVGRLVELAADGQSVTVVANHGSCDDGPTVDVLETDGSVLLSASVVGTQDGSCTSELRGEEVTVKLNRPVGERTLLDAFTARPIPYGEPNSFSPSWS